VRERDTTARYEIIELGVDEFTASLDQLVGVYAAAMQPPANQVSGRHPIMAGHTRYPAFRALTATVDGELAGFSYGFHGAAGQWWHDRVHYALAATGGQIAASTWLADTFELAELHVLPDHQGRGIGSALLRDLTTDRTERTVVLSTRDSETVARRMYRGLGFTDLVTGFRFDGVDQPYAVMGADLPLRPRR
jgi:ribosomal protein S18 acetylase RimI-like enzyme